MNLRRSLRSDVMVKRRKHICEEVESIAQECDLLDLPDVTDWLQTGCTGLDFAISNRYPGGLPCGRIIQIYGGSSTAKSLFANTCMGYAQRAGWETYYDDVERSIHPDFSSMYGMSMRDPGFHMWHSETIEEMFDDNIGDLVESAEELKKDGNDVPKRFVVIDSITNLPAKIEQAKGMDEQGYGAYRAKQIHLGLRTWGRRMVDNNITLLVIDQTRDNVKSPFQAETTVGGKGLEFLSTVRIYLKHAAKIVNSKKMAIGTWVNATVVKTRFGPPWRKCQFRIQYDYGLDDISTNLALLALCQGVTEKETMKLTTKVLFKGETYTIKKWVSVIEENEWEEDLRKFVWESWQDLYASDPRKARQW